MCSPPHPDRLWSSLSLLFYRMGALTQGKAGHSPADVKNAWSFISTTPRVFMVRCFNEHGKPFTAFAMSVEFPRNKAQII